MSKPVAAIVIAILSFSSNSLKKMAKRKPMYFPSEGVFRVGFHYGAEKKKVLTLVPRTVGDLFG
jgi:hypothetical protein